MLGSGVTSDIVVGPGLVPVEVERAGPEPVQLVPVEHAGPEQKLVAAQESLKWQRDPVE